MMRISLMSDVEFDVVISGTHKWGHAGHIERLSVQDRRTVVQVSVRMVYSVYPHSFVNDFRSVVFCCISINIIEVLFDILLINNVIWCVCWWFLKDLSPCGFIFKKTHYFNLIIIYAHILMPLSRRFRDRNKTPLEPSAFNGQFVISIIVFSNH